MGILVCRDLVNDLLALDHSDVAVWFSFVTEKDAVYRRSLSLADVDTIP